MNNGDDEDFLAAQIISASVFCTLGTIDTDLTSLSGVPSCPLYEMGKSRRLLSMHHFFYCDFFLGSVGSSHKHLRSPTSSMNFKVSFSLHSIITINVNINFKNDYECPNEARAKF